LTERLRRAVTIPYDLEVCKTYASLKARLEKDGNLIADNDLWIAACALRHSIPLVSNNHSHFVRVPGLILLSETDAVTALKSQTAFPTSGSTAP